MERKRIFKKILESLKRGAIIELENDEYNYSAIWFDDGVWYYKYQNCFSDTCNCVSHERYITEESVPRWFVLEKIQEYINDILEEEIETEREREWLNRLIESI